MDVCKVSEKRVVVRAHSLASKTFLTELNSEGEERERTKVPGRRNHLSIRTRSSKGENKNERLALVELTSPSFPFPPLRVPNLVLTDP